MALDEVRDADIVFNGCLYGPNFFSFLINIPKFAWPDPLPSLLRSLVDIIEESGLRTIGPDPFLYSDEFKVLFEAMFSDV